MTTPGTPRGRTAVTLVFVFIGLYVLFRVASCVKERWVDPDRLLLGVHALDEREALVVYRYDGGDALSFRVGRLDLEQDDLLWEHDLDIGQVSTSGQGLTVAGGLAVYVTAKSDTETTVTALELDSGEPRWTTVLEHGEGSSEIAGNERFVFVQADDPAVFVLDRETGLERARHEYSQFTLAYTDDWLELRGTELTYLDLETMEPAVIEGTRGAQCRVGTIVYGGERKRGFVGRDLMGGGARVLLGAQVDVGGIPASSHRPEACGWRRAPDGTLRLIFIGADEHSVIFAVDVDESDPTAPGTLAWTVDLGGRVAQTGKITYGVQNRLDLVWYGAMPKVAPLVLRPDTSADVRADRVALIDVRAGRLRSEGAPVEQTLEAFFDGQTVFIRVSEHFPDQAKIGHLITLDGNSGVLLGSLQQPAVHAGPPSIAGDAVWVWGNAFFSRASNLAVGLYDRRLELQHARDQERVPRADPEFAAALLGL